MGQQDQSANQPASRNIPAIPSRRAEPEQQAVIEALAAGELEQLKTRLFTALTHELRTPLASLRLAAGLLVSAPPPGATEDHRQLFQLILHSSDRLDLLLTSLLDYARLEASHPHLERQTVDLRLILESVVNLLAPHFRARRQTLDLHLPEQPVNVHGDPFRLRSAAQALLDTASSRCPNNGKLNLGCRAQEYDAVGWVCDTGPHVPEEARGQPFTHVYWQAAEEIPQLSGFGLGLPFAHKLMSLHGGNLWLTEPEGEAEGMCFHFSLPLAPG
ncbi:MAG TPA: HAMP domain-containing sensor histidine kinase [Ktedonobacterales bacterium]|jgi:signal transduction histidine kinase